MATLKQITILILLTAVTLPAQASTITTWQAGLKQVHKNVKGQQISTNDTRLYAEAGIYNKVDTLSYGMAINVSPNLFDASTKSLINWKVIDTQYQFGNGHRISAYGGALKQFREFAAYGYSLGFGYHFEVNKLPVSTTINWSRTNTDIGGKGTDTGAKDNLIWLNVGIHF